MLKKREEKGKENTVETFAVVALERADTWLDDIGDDALDAVKGTIAYFFRDDSHIQSRVQPAVTWIERSPFFMSYFC